MKITKQELEELNKKGKVEVRLMMCGKEYWDTIEVEK